MDYFEAYATDTRNPEPDRDAAQGEPGYRPAWYWRAHDRGLTGGGTPTKDASAHYWNWTEPYSDAPGAGDLVIPTWAKVAIAAAAVFVAAKSGLIG